MAKATMASAERTELQLLKQSVTKALSDNLWTTGTELSFTRQLAFDHLVVSLRTHILADHLEHQTVDYTEIVLPRWLRFLDRFVQKNTKRIVLNAYHTYPEARVPAIFGEPRKVVTFEHFTLPEEA